MNDLDSSTAALGMGIIMIFLIIGIPIVVMMIIAMWKVFQKAGFEGWECIVPIYNLLVLLKIVGKPWWWIFLLIIPVVNYVFLVWIWNMLSKSFGKDEGFTVGLVFLSVVFIPILGFGNAQYLGPFGDPILFQAYRNRHQQGFDFERQKMA